MSRALLVAVCLLTLAACRAPEPPPEPDGQATPATPDLANVDDTLRRRIELLQAALENETGDGSGDLAARHGKLGNVYHIAELLDAAAASYGEARRLAPGDVRWPYYEGMVHQSRGELELAAASFERALALESSSLAPLLRLAETERRLNRLEASGRSFAAALELDPASAAAHAGLGRLAAIGGDHRSAVRHFERALELQPEADALHYPLAQAHRQLGEKDRARFHLEGRGEHEARFPDPLAERLSRTKTLTAFALVEAQAGDRGQLSDEDFLGFAIEQIGDVEAAPEQLATLLERGPNTEPAGGEPAWRGRMHYAIGGILARPGADAEAVEHFRHAVELDPELRDARLRLANGLARLKRYADAETQYSVLLDTDPADGAILLKRATARLNLGRFEAAGTDLRRLVAAEPENGMAQLRLAAVLRRAGEHRAELAALEKALAADLPGRERVLAQSQLARLLATCPLDDVRDGNRAVEIAEALFREDESLSNAETLAMALAEAGRFEEAAALQRRLLAEAARLGHDDQRQWLAAALARYERGQALRIP